MKYKVGDRIVCVKFPDSNIIGEVGYVNRVFCSPTARYVVEAKFPGLPDCPMRAEEIESYHKEEQLLFPFMLEVSDE